MTVLNWQNDPIYFDDVSKEVNHWINANELMENNRQVEIFLPNTETLNLFPILVRRADFLRVNSSDRILARLPFIQLTEKEKVLFKNQELLVSEKLRDYFYQSDNRKILEWRDILRNYLERGAIPLPFFRCYPDEWGLDFQDRILEFSRGETFAMPTRLTTELAYLCGMVNGDGNLTKYVLNIVDYSIENIRQLKEQFERLFQQTGRIQLQTENCPKLIITNLWVARLFSFLTDQPIGGKKYSNLRGPLLFLEQPLRSHYWSGVMDADGSYTNRNITFTSASKNYTQDFISFMKSISILAKQYSRNDGTFQVYISRKFHDIYKSQLLCLHPEEKLQFNKLQKGISKNYGVRIRKKFVDFDKDKMINGFFDFRFLTQVHIIGLGDFLRIERETKTLKSFSKELGVSDSFLSMLENERSAIPIELLLKILQRKNKQLMHFLLLNKQHILYRKGSSKPIKLNLKPNKELLYLATKMTFHKASISLPLKKQDLQDKITDRFGVIIKKNRIDNKLLLYYFTTFCKLKKID